MPYRSSEKTRQKKETKRTAMMQAAVRVFADKGYHAATVRDIVGAADVAIGTFYFYFPDKETLFVHLYEETAHFLLQAIKQAVDSHASLDQQIKAGLRAYTNIAVYEPAVVQLLLVGGVGAVPSLAAKRTEFRERLIRLWQQPLETALAADHIAPQNCRRTAEALAGAFDEVILNLLHHPTPESEATAVIDDVTSFALRAAAFRNNENKAKDSH
jgi:AcrR family transcriptional regulator